MKYISTRGKGARVSFEDALLRGLAPDGGLYMPESWPQLDADWQSRMKGAPYTEFAFLVAKVFAGGCFSDAELERLVCETYAPFDDPAVAPLRELEPGLFLLELFHGPTFAFKDFAMQMLGHLFEAVLKKRGERRTIIVATSGDTGAAAVEALGDREALDLFVLHPEGRISNVQRRQMTTSTAGNVHNISVQGTFDDCQAVLKTLFADESFRDEVSLGAVNSINWARIMAQATYYLSTLAQLGGPASFSVPTGNFGDIFAGFVAHKMGAALGPLVIATNTNDILHRALTTGVYKTERAAATLSPAMDIQIASNFERLLFELLDRDAGVLEKLMSELAAEGSMVLPAGVLERMRALFGSCRVSDDETVEEISNTYERSGIMIDPHTAVGLRAAREVLGGGKLPRVVLATAHPAKFADTVMSATGKAPHMPPRLARVLELEERFDRLPPNANEIMSYVRARI